jgi:hypothetical protein
MLLFNTISLHQGLSDLKKLFLCYFVAIDNSLSNYTWLMQDRTLAEVMELSSPTTLSPPVSGTWLLPFSSGLLPPLCRLYT